MSDEDREMEYQEPGEQQVPESSVPATPAPPAPIPTLTSLGLLPPGIHTADLGEVERAFGASNARRAALWGKFMQWLTLLRTEDLAVSIFLDGSFTTSKPLPGDIDLVVELPAAAAIRSRGITNQFLHLINRVQVKAQYELDVLPWTPEAPPKTPRDLVDFFQRVRPNVAAELGVGPDFRKGIIRVML